MTTATSLAKSIPGLVAGICVALTLVFGLIFDNFRMGLVTGIVAGAIVALSLMLIDVTHDEVGSGRRR